MIPSYSYCYEGSNNDSRYPDKLVKRSNVKKLKIRYFPKDPEKEKVPVEGS